LSVGAATRSKFPPTGRRGLRGATSSRALVLSEIRLVGGGRPNRMGTPRGDRQHLDDVTLQRALSSAERPAQRRASGFSPPSIRQCAWRGLSDRTPKRRSRRGIPEESPWDLGQRSRGRTASTCNSAEHSLCRQMRPKPRLPTKISSPSGKTPTPTSPS